MGKLLVRLVGCLTAGPGKCFFAFHEIKHLDFSSGNGGTSPLDDKVRAPLDIPLSETKIISFVYTLSPFLKFVPTLRSPSGIELESDYDFMERMNISERKLCKSPDLASLKENKKRVV